MGCIQRTDPSSFRWHRSRLTVLLTEAIVPARKNQMHPWMGLWTGESDAAYQQAMKQKPAKARHRPGESARPQQKHRVAAMITACPAASSTSAPMPYPVAASEP
uniref:Uncharacterized protein n=1 Tax=Oryza meridionalis TaxID=40149 RepID=A0A0E0DK67_9ORYZ